MINYDIAYTTLLGTRPDQQDSCNAIIKHGMAFAVVCDGLGGHQGGALASGLAVKMLSKSFESQKPGNIPMFLVENAQDINEAVYDISDESGKKLGAGTTIVCTVTDEDKLYWISIGDSRIYLYRDGELTQITEDHNFFLLLKERLENGLITEEEFEQNICNGNSLISVLGMREVGRVCINIKPLVLEDSDILLLMSDGLYKALDDQSISDCLTGSASECSENLKKRLAELDLTDLDNTTFIVQKIIKER